MLTIRFNRTGKRNRAHFRIVLQEHTIAPGGKHVEILGSYDPHLKKGVFKEERIKYWIGKGAQLSDSVHNLLVKQGIVGGKKRPVKIHKKKEKEGEIKETEKLETKEISGEKPAAEKIEKKEEIKEIKKTETKENEEIKKPEIKKVAETKKQDKPKEKKEESKTEASKAEKPEEKK